MPDPVRSQNSPSTDRYRAMTRAASALFTAESEAELAARLDTWAKTIFPDAEWRLQPLDLEPPPSSDRSDGHPEAVAHSLAAKTLTDSANHADDRSVHWVDPAAALRSSSATGGTSSLPEALAVIPLAPDTNLPRAALLVYPDAAPTRPEREAADAFADLARDASTACSSPSPSEASLPDPTGSLIEVVNTIASRLELPAVIRVVAEQTSDLLNADRSSVWLYDEDTDEIYTIVAQKLGREKIRMPADQGVAGHVLHTGEPLNLEDAYDHPAFDESHDRETGYRTRSMLCTPLRNRQGETLGVFQVINKQDGDHFTATDRTLLETLAGSASVAIENALLYEQGNRI